MHPEIKKFWEATGYQLHGPSLIKSWELHIGTSPIWRIEIVCHGDKHRFNNVWYSEAEMLRIIRQKAFL